MDVTTDSLGNILVTDSENHRIVIFDSDGLFITQIHLYSKPYSIMLDADGHIWIKTSLGPTLKIDFEDAVASFTEQFEQISCDADSMVNDPVTVPDEIAAALPVSELLSKANSFAESEQFDDALFMYYIASQIEPGNVHAWNGIGYSQTFVCTNGNDNDINSPIDAYNHALLLDDSNINALNGLGFYYTTLAQLESQRNIPVDMIQTTADLAIANYDKVLELDDSNINALNGLGTIHIILEQYDEAIEKFVLSYNQDSQRVSTLNGMADAQLKSGNLILAESFYKDALDSDANNFNALSGLLRIYIQQDDQSKIDDTIDRLAQFTQQVVDSLIAEGEWFLERGSTEEAIRFFEKALELDPGNEKAENLLRETRQP